MTIREVGRAEPSQETRRREIPPIVEKIAKWGGWIGAGLCFGFWIHSAFVFAGIAFFIGHLAARQIVKVERGLGTSPSQNLQEIQKRAPRPRMVDELSDEDEAVAAAGRMVPGVD